MRIIAGKYKNHGILSPPTPATRPTSDRARESIFNIINSLDRDLLVGGFVLDAFAGSGALGLEALSRGASQVTFMESNPKSFQTLQANIAKLKAESHCKPLLVDVLKPPRAPQPMNIVFLDPPYDQRVETPCLGALNAQGWIDAKTLIILEISSKRELNLPLTVNLIDQRRYGAALISFLYIGD